MESLEVILERTRTVRESELTCPHGHTGGYVRYHPHWRLPTLKLETKMVSGVCQGQRRDGYLAMIEHFGPGAVVAYLACCDSCSPGIDFWPILAKKPSGQVLLPLWEKHDK